jgi:hypothetical protein
MAIAICLTTMASPVSSLKATILSMKQLINTIRKTYNASKRSD